MQDRSKFFKGLALFAILLLVGAGCAAGQQAAEENEDAMMEKDGDAMMESHMDGDAMMKEDGEAMMKDGEAMMEAAEKMMEEGEAMMEKGESMMKGESMEEGEAMEKDGEAMEEKAAANSVSFNMGGRNFAFTMNGQDNPDLRVKQGDTVTVNFTSDSGFHDWVVDEFNAKTARVQSGGSTSVTFVASEKGTFSYYCSVGSHRAQGMEGRLIVE